MKTGENTTVILSTAYAAPVQFYTLLARFNACLIETHENYQKQTYRNRCQILSANGPLTLSIPVNKGESEKCPIKDVMIDYSKRWQVIHWRAIESAYRSSPYFIHYADDIYPLYKNPKYLSLFDFNHAFLEVICSALRTEQTLQYP